MAIDLYIIRDNDLLLVFYSAAVFFFCSRFDLCLLLFAVCGSYITQRTAQQWWVILFIIIIIIYLKK